MRISIYPRQNVSAMDGFAQFAQSQQQQGDGFTVIGESCAGTPFNGEILPNQAVRIFTGAVVPEGCDMVVMQEHTTFDQINITDKSQPYYIVLTKPAKVSANIATKAKRLLKAMPLLSAGKRLNPSDISLLSGMGYDEIEVFSPLRIGLIATGTMSWFPLVSHWVIWLRFIIQTHQL